MAESRFLKAALRYAEIGWKVFPIKPGQKKPPLVDFGTEATTDEAVIRAWWKRWPGANVAVKTGEALFAVDVDPDTGGEESLERLEREHGKLPDTRQQMTPRGGRHHVFRAPDFQVHNSESEIAPGIDIRGHNGYILVAPSTVGGKRYQWDGADADQPLLPCSPWFLELLQRKNGKAKTDKTIPDKIPKGVQHKYLVSVAGTMRKRGLEFPEIYEALLAINKNRCSEPGPEDHIRQYAKSVCDYPPDTSLDELLDKVGSATPGNGSAAAAPAPALEPSGPRAGKLTLAEVKELFQKWLYIPDPGFLSVTFAALAANLVKDGDPLWLLLVGPPSSGKTEALDSLLKLPHVHPAGTLTEAALLSGSPNRQKAKDASGGLLRKIGDFGILICKDFTSVLSMARESRGPMLAALREIYDGAWTRHVGTDGGRELYWRGRCAFLGGCTSVIDSHHAVMSAMGERFVLYRLRAGTAEREPQAAKALERLGKEIAIRRELLSHVTAMFEGFAPGTFTYHVEDKNRLTALSSFVALARSAVERDSHNREIDLIPDPERPARLVKTFARLLHGLRALGEEEVECWRLTKMVARSSIPDIRWKVLDHIYRNGVSKTTEIAMAVHYPTTTARRALEDLTAHEMVDRDKEKREDIWNISSYAYDLAARSEIVPEK